MSNHDLRACHSPGRAATLSDMSGSTPDLSESLSNALEGASAMPDDREHTVLRVGVEVSRPGNHF